MDKDIGWNELSLPLLILIQKNVNSKFKW